MAGIEITTKIGCQLACGHCPQEIVSSSYAKTGGSLYLSLDSFKQCISTIPKTVLIDFSGFSEPWLNPECTDMILYAHRRGYKIRIFTTLHGLALSDIDLLESVPFLGFKVHLPCKEYEDKIAKDDTYLELLKRVAFSKIENVEFRLHGEVESFDILRAIRGRKRSLVKLPLNTRAGNVALGNRIYPKKRKRLSGCLRELRQNVLLPNGDVLLCSMDYRMKHVLGNLLTSDYISLFKGKEFLGIKNGCGEILCRYCDSFSYDNIASPATWRSFLFGYRFARV